VLAKFSQSSGEGNLTTYLFADGDASAVGDPVVSGCCPADCLPCKRSLFTGDKPWLPDIGNTTLKAALGFGVEGGETKGEAIPSGDNGGAGGRLIVPRSQLSNKQNNIMPKHRRA